MGMSVLVNEMEFRGSPWPWTLNVLLSVCVLVLVYTYGNSPEVFPGKV